MKHSRWSAVVLAVAALMPGAGASAEGDVQNVEVKGKFDPEWSSYRYAYQASVFTNKFLRKRPLVQSQLQLRPLDPLTPVTGLKVTLEGAKTHVEMVADDLGRVDMPELKQAFDEDAVLRLNRPKGLYKFSGRFSIKPREDGEYGVADLQEACEQLIGAQREAGYRMRLWGKKCVGVKFSYPVAASGVSADFHAADDHVTPIAAVDGRPFEDDSMGTYKIVVVRFADWPKTGRVVTHDKPLAIGTLYE